jgi:hypothetical protein
VWGSVVFPLCCYSRLLLLLLSLFCRYCCCWWWWCWCCLALKFLSQPPVQCIPGLFPGGKAAEALRCPPTPTRTDVTERVELQLYRPPPPGLSWPVLGQTLSLPLQNTEIFLALCYIWFIVIYFFNH